MKFKGLCQLENSFFLFVLILLITSCSHQVVEVDYSKYVIEAKWLSISTDHTFKEYQENKSNTDLLEVAVPHPFYDLEFKGLKDKELKYYPITNKGENVLYDFDLLSGTKYRVRNLCKFKDSWKSYSKELELPNYTEGLVPGVLNQQKEPMKIIVFSSTEKKFPKKRNVKYFDMAQVVGSLLLEECDSYPCTSKDKWKKSQVLVGVVSGDQEFGKIENFFELKKQIDWDYSKAFLINSKGNHQLGNNFLPAFRISGELGPVETLEYFNKNAIVQDLKSVAIAREACMSLQDEIWKDFQKIRNTEHFQKDHFKEFLINFSKNLRDQYLECDKLVRPANINQSHDKHWFFTFISLFANLEKEGLYYNCASSGWFYNPKVEDGKFYVSQVKELEKCNEKDIEKSFDQAINALGSMKNQLNKYFRYIEYDSEQGGSLEKIYNWIKFDNRKLSCEQNRTSFDFFPQDVVWQQLKDDEEKVVH